jgi:hypothetical protein
VELTALLITVTDDEPRVLTIADGAALPSGPFEQSHRSLQTGLRAWVERQTRHPLGYLEQLYTFADRDRPQSGQDGGRVISIGYLGLTREGASSGFGDSSWRSWYRYFPWEDRRTGPSANFTKTLMPQLRRWQPSKSAFNASRSISAMATSVLGTKNWFSSVTSFSTRRAWSLRPSVARRMALRPSSASRCTTIIGASWRRALRACEPKSNIVLSSLN